MKQTPDFWKMAENFSDADDGEVPGVNDDVAPGGAHLVATNPEEFERWITGPQRIHQLRAVHFARSFARRDQNAHRSIVTAQPLLDLNLIFSRLRPR